MKCHTCNIENSENSNFCGSCGKALIVVCAKCNYPNENNSKFCQECGLKLGSAKIAEPTASILEPPPSVGITIEFSFSTASSFDFAVQEAQKLPNFKQFGENKKAIYRVTVSQNEIQLLANLLENLKGWRKRTVYVDGQKTLWDSVFSYSWCYEEKKVSYKPQFYCLGFENEWEFNLWGCKNARMPFRENCDWTTWGRWLNNQGDWEFDKVRIRHELEKNLFQYRFCPALNFQQVEAVLSAIPNVVNPWKDDSWKTVESWSSDGSGGLKVVIEKYGFQQETIVKGVYPTKKAIQEIARKVSLQIP